MIRPVIGITAWKRPLKTALDDAEVLHALAEPYAAAVRTAGGIPVLFPTGPSDEAAGMLDLVDGLIVSGGGDVAPGSYGRPDEGVSYDMNAEADAFELALIRHAESRDLPVLGICRGLQVLNVAFGGTLIQNLATPIHGSFSGMSGEEIMAARHEVVLEPGSTLAGIYGSERREVNNIHHQAIDVVADGFRAVAHAPDGVIEAIEAVGTWLAVAVQWHPERLDDPAEAVLFSSFVDAVRARLAEPGGVRFA